MRPMERYFVAVTPIGIFMAIHTKNWFILAAWILMFLRVIVPYLAKKKTK